MPDAEELHQLPRSATKEADAEEEDESDEEDEDYIPPTEGNDEDEDRNSDAATRRGIQQKEAVEGTSPSFLPPAKRKAVDEAFASLFGNASREASSSSAEMDIYRQSEDSNKKKRKKSDVKTERALRKKRQILSDLFGSTEASKLLATSKSVVSDASSMKSRSSATRIIKIPQKKVVTEIKKFAGQQIAIQRNILVTSSDQQLEETTAAAKASSKSASMADSTESAQLATEAKNSTAKPSLPPPTHRHAVSSSVNTDKKGIDNLLSELSNPTKISTITKTSVDWDNFKTLHKLEDELEQKAKGKDAYLVKQDFLQRVDLRTFEKEKEERDKKRAAAGKL